MRRHRFVVASHARPDGDSIGSQMAITYALRALGKQVRVVNKDAAPQHYFAFPGVGAIEIADSVEGQFDAAIVMECSDVRRTEVAGLERYFLINIDHHIGNTAYGDLNWFDETAAACGEMVMDLIDALGVALSPEIATHVYLAILTDTGSFHHSSISARTFEICRRAVEAGVDPAAMARSVFDSSSFGKLKLIGALLASMKIEADGRLAILYLDDAMLEAAGSTINDTEGLINLPLTAREIKAVVFFKAVNGEIPGEPPLEGPCERARHRQELRRRRPSERRRLHPAGSARGCVRPGDRPARRRSQGRGSGGARSRLTSHARARRSRWHA